MRTLGRQGRPDCFGVAFRLSQGNIAPRMRIDCSPHSRSCELAAGEDGSGVAPKVMSSQRKHLQVARDWMITAKKPVEVRPAVEGTGAEVFTAEAHEIIAEQDRRIHPNRLDQ